jgi:hypothetical protein
MAAAAKKLKACAEGNTAVRFYPDEAKSLIWLIDVLRTSDGKE